MGESNANTKAVTPEDIARNTAWQQALGNNPGSYNFDWYMSPEERAARAKEAAFIDRIAEAVVAKLKAAQS